MNKILLVSLLLISGASIADQPRMAAVASAHPLATDAAIEILQQGGNAFDAAAAISAALTVVDPSGSGLGGGGFWLLHRESDGKDVMIDGREKAPEFAHARMYLDEKDEIKPRMSRDGPMAGGIPGIPAGIIYLATTYGRLPLATSLAPAIRYAKEGFAITAGLQDQIDGRADVLSQYPPAAEIFLPNGKVPEAGDILVQKDLGNTLQSMADKGLAGFYYGDMAARIIQGMQQYGGIWSLKDLEQYFVVERPPMKFTYKDVSVITASLPSSGGVVMAQTLKMLEHFDLDSMDRVSRAHHAIEALRRAYRDRSLFLGDPDFSTAPLDKLLDPEYIETLTLTINPDKATPSDDLADLPGPKQSGESTTHFSIIDTEGNRVAGTLSINTSLGSGFVIPGTGVLVNNEMDDFAIKPDTPNAYGLIGFEANAIVPGKRPLSSMSPTFVESGERVGILGTPGGSRIISMVLLGILDFADGQLPESWVDLPRYHHQYKPDVVQFEAAAFNEQEQQQLIARGHEVRVTNRDYGDMHAVMWDKRTGRVYAVADKRGEGSARVWQPEVMPAP